MATKHDLVDWLYDALSNSGGEGRIAELCKYVWEMHENELRASGDLFYTWQYDIRWAAHQLRKKGVIQSDTLSKKGVWKLKKIK